jgi:hypothetical protein
MVEKKKRELTELQQKFLDYLFSDEAKGKPHIAKKLAGYSDGVTTFSVVSSLKEEIIEKSKEAMAGSAPQAYFALLDVLQNPSQAGAANALKAINEILTRGGVKEREVVETEVKQSGIVLLPAKNMSITVKIDDVVEDDNEG